jgi:hypothetical protein
MILILFYVYPDIPIFKFLVYQTLLKKIYLDSQNSQKALLIKTSTFSGDKKINILYHHLIIGFMSYEWKKLIEYLEKNGEKLEIMRVAYRGLGKTLLLENGKLPEVFEELPHRFKEAKKYASFLNKYGNPSDSVSTILGCIAIRPMSVREISEKTGMDEEYVSTMLGDLLFHGFAIIDEENGKEVFKSAYKIADLNPFNAISASVISLIAS